MPSEPKTIGRYEVQRVLGHGAMGTVYLAFDPLLKRPLAVKTVREFDADVDSAMLRFQREAEISARLNHPNIVTVHDVGLDPVAGPFMAMEYIDGLPLSDLIQRGIPPESVIHLLLQGMSALQAAEREGITHRDVKPANILVSHDGRLKLMDFGIARGEGARLTQTGQIIGTPSYTAPEALTGVEPSSVSDRYAFAVTAFQMLTCELPFECPTIAATLFRIVHEPPLFPDGMSPALRAVFEKALSKDPGDRYADLPAFLRDLIAAVDLPAATQAAFLASLSGDAGAEVAQLVQAHVEAAAVDRDRQTQATPSRVFQKGREEPATQAFRSPGPDTTLVSAPAVRKPRWAWIAATLVGLGLLGSAAAWELQPHGFLLAVSSAPPGARVFINGKEIGRTDLAGARMPQDGGTLRLELEGYAPQQREVHPGDGPVQVVLEHPPFTVRVVTDPPGAEAFLNGAALGATPIQELRVPDGRQELVLRLRDHLDWSRVLERDTSLPGVIRLEPRGAAARARLRPAPAAA
ncbi:MAG: serine/threonine protein kinase, partial [Holophaga sp.]|nr:serine/threonine protein kinase [Holophaga sp.]